MNYKALFAVKIGDEDWQEQLITEEESRIPAASEWAKANGFDRLRIVSGDDSEDPVKAFVKAFNR